MTHANPRPSKIKQHIDSETKIGFIGAGKIAQAMIAGFINYGKISAKNIYVAAPSMKNLEHLKTMGVHTTKRNIDIFAKYDCDIIFLCVPGSAIKNCYTLSAGAHPHPLTVNFIPNVKHKLHILSLVPGVELSSIKQCLLHPDHPDKYDLEIHRIVMSNSCAHGLGVCGIDVDPERGELSSYVRSLLSTVAKLEYIPESQMDAGCALIGAGLAFSYYVCNALADGSVKMGLDRSNATKFAAKTLLSAGQALLESGKHPGELKNDACSPAGPAIYGIHMLDKADVASGVIAAIEVAYKRTQALDES